ncbi:Phage major capsid protein [Azospirillaceae bacterium]
MLTLLEAAKLMTSPLAQGVVEIFAANNAVLERLSFVDVQGNSYRYNREGALPGIAFRGINESYGESTGVLNPQVETLTICGGDSDYDVALVKMGAGSNNLRAVHDGMKAKALTLTWLKTFFDGNAETNPREFDGLNRRLTGSQVIDLPVGGGTLTLDALDELVDAVSGTPSALLMNKTMRRKITKLAQNTPAVTMSTDALGRPMASYAGVPIGIVEDDAAGNPVLGFDEDDGQGNVDTCSIYAVRFDMDGLHGIQTAAMDVRDLGEQQAKPAYRTRIEWYSGMVVKHPRAAARLRRINNA